MLDEFLDKLDNFKGSPIIAAAAAIVLVVCSVTLALSCGEESTPPANTQAAATGTMPSTSPSRGTAAPSRTAPAGSSSTSSSQTNPYLSSPNGTTMWSKVFTRKDPWIQRVYQTATSAGGASSPLGGATSPTFPTGGTTGGTAGGTTGGYTGGTTGGTSGGYTGGTTGGATGGTTGGRTGGTTGGTGGAPTPGK